jgi:hypothetical protein
MLQLANCSKKIPIALFVALCYIDTYHNSWRFFFAMAGPYRLDDNIVSHAEASAELQKRSVPKQLEYWAEIGRRVEQQVDVAGLMAIIQDLAIIDVRPLQSRSVDAKEIFEELEADRASGRLAQVVTQASVVYEASVSHPGFLDQIDKDGRRVAGYFKNGEFVAGTNLHGTTSSTG